MVAKIHTVAGLHGGPETYDMVCRTCDLSLAFRSYGNAVIVRDKHNLDKHKIGAFA